MITVAHSLKEETFILTHIFYFVMSWVQGGRDRWNDLTGETALLEQTVSRERREDSRQKAELPRWFSLYQVSYTTTMARLPFNVPLWACEALGSIYIEIITWWCINFCPHSIFWALFNLSLCHALGIEARIPLFFVIHGFLTEHWRYFRWGDSLFTTANYSASFYFVHWIPTVTKAFFIILFF